MTLSAERSVAEGGLIHFIATVDNPVSVSDLQVLLSNGLTLVIPVGKTTGSITVSAPTDDVYLDASHLLTTITGVQGGAFARLGLPLHAVETAIPDTIDPTLVTLSASHRVDEGSKVVYTATLSHPAGSELTVTLSNGSSIVIPAGGSNGSVEVSAPLNTPWLENGHHVDTTITSTQGGNFEQLVVDRSPLTIDVINTIDTTTVSLSATPTVSEGGQIVYTATLDHAAQGAVTVKLDNGHVITIADKQTSGSVSVTAGNDVYVGQPAVHAHIVDASGGNFEKLVADPQPVVTTITDTTDTTTVTLTADKSTLTEAGGEIIYTATLAHESHGVTTVHTQLGDITIADGDRSGTLTHTVPVGEDVYRDPSTVSNAITGAEGGNFERLVPNTAPVTTTITDTIDTTTISLTAPSTVVEGSTITYTAQVDHPVTGSDLVLTLSNGQQLTIPVGASSGTLDVATRPADVLAQGDSQVALSITSTQGGNYERLDSSAHVSTTVTDSALPVHVTLTGSPDVKEGGVVTWTAQVDHAPVTPLLLTLDNGSEITIKAGELTGSVDVKVHPDTVYVDAGVVNAAITASSGGGYSHLELPSGPSAVSVGDTIDTTTISLTAPSTVVEGSTITYTAQVDHPVTGSDLVLTLSNGQQLTIPVGASSGTLDVATRPADVLAQGDSQVALSITSTQGGNYERLDSSAHVSTTVTDSALPVHVTLTGSPDVKEGGVVTWTAQVDHAPVTPLLLTLDNGSEITIKAGELTGSVDVKVHPDTVYVDAGVVNAAITASSGGGYSHLELPSGPSAVSVGDTIDTTTVSLSATPTVSEGGQIVYTATLDHAAQGAVTVSSTMAM
ncbi:hypothetical protein NMD14_09325 [Aeromonas veronii]